MNKAKTRLSHSYPTWQTLSYLQTLSPIGTTAPPAAALVSQTILTTNNAIASRSSSSNIMTNTLPHFPPRETYAKQRHHQDHVLVTTPQSPLKEANDDDGGGEFVGLGHSKHHHRHHQQQSHHHLSPNDEQLWKELFTLELPEGHCVGLQLLTEDINTRTRLSTLRQFLNAKEVEYGTSLKGQPALISFFLGRLAIRTALRDVSSSGESQDGYPILRDEHGRPVLPTGYLGSISHKRLMGVALVDLDDCGTGRRRRGIGVDVEQSYTRRQNVGKRVLTQRERDDLGKIKGVTRDEEVLLRFSLKESVYKAMHPLLAQYVGFQEAEVYPQEDGTAEVYLNLKNGAHERFSQVTAHWRRIQGDYFLTSASVTLKDEEDDT
eukprot:CAMPEP_0172512714 /NCGR_PEP_ID=MMETSP1066-20121228/246648_1 /TAXON_ID=671091 /ORGANISM="Coscinodiscus wailesii, Strain CCMP2513" /LENGTH=377 /DNA_ID=CAMNT_0013292641 /DNA_START=414 /DNA_END=1547 /DNA_ORIENTATION=+